MIILNFSHPLTEKQQAAISSAIGEPVDRVAFLERRFTREPALAQQIQEVVDEAGLSAEEWQTLRLVINPPAWAPATATLLAELHGRMGYFPEIVHIQPATGPGERYELAEVIDLRQVRSNAARRRT